MAVSFNSCDGKIAHASHRAAGEHRNVLLSRKGGRYEHAAYRCRLCGYWHVGRSAVKRKQWTGELPPKTRRVVAFGDED